MSDRRKVEVFIAGCGLCHEAMKLVESLACPSCDVTTIDVNSSAGLARAKEVGVTQVPAVAVAGKLAKCCCAEGPTEAGLRAAGIGVGAA